MYKVFSIVVTILVLAAAAFGIVRKSSYTDITADDSYLEECMVGEFPESIAALSSDNMRQNLGNSPYILRVTPVGGLENDFHISQQKVTVKEVFKGDDISEGDEFYLYYKSWFVGVNPNDDPSPYISRGYVNIMQKGKDYLVFLTEKIEQYRSATPVYKVADGGDFLIYAPVFCYDDMENIVSDNFYIKHSVPSTFVPYREVKGNEIFAASEGSRQIMENLKKEMINRYPAGSGKDRAS